MPWRLNSVASLYSKTIALISSDRLSHLIGLIYQCALEPELWPRTMQEICDELGFRTAVISILALPGGEPLVAASVGFEEPWLDRVFFFAEQLVDLWGGSAVIGALPLGEPAVLSKINPVAIDERSAHPFHIAFNKPQGFIDALAIGLMRDPHSIGTIGFNRHLDAGPIGEREVSIMRLLLPHLQRAATISRVLEAHSLAIRQFDTLLDNLTVPVAVVSADLVVKFSNRAFADLLESKGRNLDVINSYLRLRFGPAQSVLTATLRNAVDGRSFAGKGAFGLPIGGPGERVQSLHILPLPAREASESLFALILSAFSANLESAGLMVASLFGLTEAERRVFEHIAAGLTVDEAADRLGIAASTVRTHLIRIFSKTETGRQAELVSLAAEFRPMVRGQ